MTKWEIRKRKAEQKVLDYLREHEGKFSVFWATENQDRAKALERLDKKNYIDDYSTELGYPYAWYKYVSNRNIIIPMDGWTQEWECEIKQCYEETIWMHLSDITNPNNNIEVVEILRYKMFPEGIDKNLKEGHILYWYIYEDISIFSFKRKNRKDIKCLKKMS